MGRRCRWVVFGLLLVCACWCVVLISSYQWLVCVLMIPSSVYQRQAQMTTQAQMAAAEAEAALAEQPLACTGAAPLLLGGSADGGLLKRGREEGEEEGIEAALAAKKAKGLMDVGAAAAAAASVVQQQEGEGEAAAGGEAPVPEEAGAAAMGLAV